MTFGILEGGTNCHLWFGKIPIIIEDAFFKELPCLQQADQFVLCQGHSSNKHFQWKSMTKNSYNCNVIANVITKLDIQTHVVMFYFLFSYQVIVTSFLAFRDQSSIFL